MRECTACRYTCRLEILSDRSTSSCLIREHHGRKLQPHRLRRERDHAALWRRGDGARSAVLEVYVPGAKSSDSRPAIVTRPVFLGYLN